MTLYSLFSIFVFSMPEHMTNYITLTVMFGVNFWFSLLFSGEIGRLRKFWLAGACHSKLSRKQTSDDLGILNFTSAFILLAAGIVLGGLLLFLEHLYFRFGRKCLKQYDKCGCCALVSLVCTLIYSITEELYYLVLS